MSAAVREALEAVAGPIVEKYVERALQLPDLRRSAQSMLQLVQEVLTRGCMVQVSPTDALRLSPTQQWLVNVEWVFQQMDAEFGRAARFVLVFRLSRTPKKEESSFGRIARDISEGGLTVTLAQAEGIYRAALPWFVRALDGRGIGCDAVSVRRPSETRTWTDDSSLIALGQRLQRFAQLCARRHGRKREHSLARPVVIPAERAAELYRAG
jgi:hypothetical protein